MARQIVHPSVRVPRKTGFERIEDAARFVMSSSASGL